MNPYEKMLLKSVSKEANIFERMFLGSSPSAFEVALLYILIELKRRRELADQEKPPLEAAD